MSIEELLSVDVYSVTKSPRKITESPAAIYILTSEDIRRSGATSLPELFRLVPGMSVSRSESGRWQVSARGFHQSFSTKLQILIDGRTVYSPLMSDVYWDVQDVILEDLERIEIIRGPGASLWGANAVNGVINIITKSASRTQGGQVTVLAGDEDKALTSVRYGGQLGDAWYRLFVQYRDRDTSWVAEGEPVDDSDLMHAGFRVDWDLSAADTLTLQGDVHEGQTRIPLAGQSLIPPYMSDVAEVNDVQGFNVLGRYTHEASRGDTAIVEVYYDRAERHSVQLPNEDRDTFDIDFQYACRLWSRHDLMWGAGCRYTEDETTVGEIMHFTPSSSSDELYSVFLQDDVGMLEDKLHLIVGAKYERNDYTGSEFQPSGRLLWNAHERHSLWVSVSRAVRTPSRFDFHSELDIAVIPPSSASGTPTQLKFFGSESMESEKLTAYEIGYRLQPADCLFIDIAAFINDYDDLVTSSSRRPYSSDDPVPHTVVPLFRGSENKGEVRGVEVVADWWAQSFWRLTASYSFLDMDIDRERNNQETPESQASLRSLFNVAQDIEFDVTLYYVAEVLFHNIDSYYRTDLRLAWHCSDALTASVVGQNVFDSHHAEFKPDGAPYQTEIESSVYGKVTWLF